MLVAVVAVAGLILAGFGLLLGALVNAGTLTPRGRKVEILLYWVMAAMLLLLLLEFGLVFAGA